MSSFGMLRRLAIVRESHTALHPTRRHFSEECSQQHTFYFQMIHFYIISHIRLGLFLSSFQVKNFYAFNPLDLIFP
jgi:hypothetical protein